MEFQFSVKGNYYQDQESILMILKSQYMLVIINEAQEAIRQRIKHGNNLSEDEINFLNDLRRDLYIEGLE